MCRSLLAVALVGGFATSLLAADMAKVGDITIHQPWARASMGNAPNSAAYMTLETTGAEPDRLISGSTPVAERVELHTHVMEGGVAKMRPIDAIEVAPGEPTVLEPGSLHLMLRDLTQKLDAGTTMRLTLVFEHAGAVTLDVPVKGMAGGMGHGADGAMGHGHDRTN